MSRKYKPEELNRSLCLTEKVGTKEQKEISASAALSDKGLQDARQLVNTFLLAWKNYGLYPEDHTSTLKASENLVDAFGNFFSTHGDLRLTIEKDRLLCGSEVIHEVSREAPSEDIITLLYRDGVKWLEFQEGLTLEELAFFFNISYKYRLFTEEAEGDIVTALMDEELEHLDFKAVDVFWQDLLLMDFSQLPPPVPPQAEEAVNQQETDQAQLPLAAADGDTSVKSIADPSISDAQLELSESDYEELQQMVREEEGWDISEDLFEVLLIILKSQPDREKFAAVLWFVSEVAVETIERHKFNLLVKLFQSLHEFLSPEISTEKDWKPPLVQQFFHDFFTPKVFQLVSDKLLALQTSELEKLAVLSRALHYFSPEVIPFLVPVFTQRSSPEIHRMVTEIIVHLSQRDIGPLEKLTKQIGKDMGDRMMAILCRLQGDRVNQALFNLCHNSSDIVRRKAIKELIDRDSKYIQELFLLIDDPNKEIRTSFLTAIAKHKSSAVEKLLLNYLKEKPAQKDSAHIRACYEALGRCGSRQAVPFLSRTLLDKGWNSFIGSGKLVFREGAAVALALLNIPEAKDVLQKASKSKFRVIRKALAKTKTITVPGEKTDG